jgi:acetylornithine deacetylase/succinyl-diaminopimelate desuccinylase-like protein
MNKTQSEIDRAVEAAQEELIAFLQKMVQTASLPDHEHDVQNLVVQKLRAMGLEVEIVSSNFDDLRAHPALGMTASPRRIASM